MRATIALALLGAACAGQLPPDATPRQVARADCRTWLDRHANLMDGMRHGSPLYASALDRCTELHTGPGAEIDQEIARN
jgi:hypothetical protein